MKRIRLGNTVFEGLNNAYLFDGGDPITLVDTGVATPDTREQLEEGLAEYGVELADVDRVLLTHFHADHAGLAGVVQAAGGATVHVHPDDAPLVSGDADAEAAMLERRERLFTQWGMPDGPREQVTAYLEGGDGLMGESPSVELLAPGDRLAAGTETLEVVHLPGHTAGLCGFVRDRGNGEELLSGDALLPVYTPNVGGADIRVERPLAKYLTTLAGIVEREYDRAWPGHRDPIDDPTQRARDIVHHHRERTEKVLSALDEHGPADAWTVSAHLFGDLSEIHILHGPGEAYAHLEHLSEHGVVESTDGEYVRVEDDPDLDALFPAVGV